MNYTDLKLFYQLPEIETERLILRRIERKDLNDVFEYSSDPEVSKYLLWSPHKDIGYTSQYLKLIDKSYRKLNFYDWAVTLKSNGKMIGTCGFTMFDIPNNCAEIGYVISKKYWGQKIAPEAAKAIISFGFNVLNLHRIEAHFMPENAGSRRVAEKCGMKFEGVLKDRVIAKGEYRNVEIYSIISPNL